MINSYSNDFYKYTLSMSDIDEGLICTLDDSNGSIWQSKISKSDLEVLPIEKLKKVIQINLHSIQPNYNISIDFLNDSKNNLNFVLKITYSNELIEFTEKIYFKQKNSLDEINETKINRQEKKIMKLENMINKLIKKIDILEEDSYMCFEKNADYPKLLYNIPKNIDKMDISKSPIPKDNYGMSYISLNLYSNKIMNVTDYRKVYQVPIEFSKDDIRCLFFNVKVIYIYLGDTYRCDSETLNFLEFYLKNKKSLLLDELQIVFHQPNMNIDSIIEYTNYKKLSVRSETSYNFTSILNHCKINNIEFSLNQF